MAHDVATEILNIARGMEARAFEQNRWKIHVKLDLHIATMASWIKLASHAEFSFNGTGQQGSIMEVQVKGRQCLRLPTAEGKNMMISELLNTMNSNLNAPGDWNVDQMSFCINLIAGLPRSDNKWTFQKRQSLVTEKIIDVEGLEAGKEFLVMFRNTVEGLLTLAQNSVRV
jgi:hypothetical protein